MTDKGVWNTQEVRDKQLASEWSYETTQHKLFMWGHGRFGQLGQNQGPGGNTDDRSSPTQIPGTTWGTYATNAGYQGKAIKSNGTLWTWGRNNKGQQGINSQQDKSSPTQVGTGNDWKSVNSFLYGAMATKTNGTMWSWGDNRHGQLGQNNRTEYDSPRQIGTDTSWDVVSTTLMGYGIEPPVGALKTDGTLWSWGYGNYGGLGLNDNNRRSSPTQIGTDNTWSSVDWGFNIGVGIKTDGTLWAWGRNGGGQIGDNTNTQRSSPTQIPGTWTEASSGTGQSTMAIRTDGTLWGWGQNGNGNLGLNSRDSYSSPKQVGTDANWSKISTGYYYTFGVKTDNTLWAWGYEERGSLGMNNHVRYSSPTQIPGTNWVDATASYFQSSGLQQV